MREKYIRNQNYTKFSLIFLKYFITNRPQTMAINIMNFCNFFILFTQTNWHHSNWFTFWIVIFIPDVSNNLVPPPILALCDALSYHGAQSPYLYRAQYPDESLDSNPSDATVPSLGDVDGAVAACHQSPAHYAAASPPCSASRPSPRPSSKGIRGSPSCRPSLTPTPDRPTWFVSPEKRELTLSINYAPEHVCGAGGPTDLLNFGRIVIILLKGYWKRVPYPETCYRCSSFQRNRQSSAHF